MAWSRFAIAETSEREMPCPWPVGARNIYFRDTLGPSILQEGASRVLGDNWARICPDEQETSKARSAYEYLYQQIP